MTEPKSLKTNQKFAQIFINMHTSIYSIDDFYDATMVIY